MINIDCIITEGGIIETMMGEDLTIYADITEGGIIETMMGEDLTIYVDIIESGPQGPIGPKGESAYEHWLSLGNVGTINDFLLTLKGDKGDKGDPGDGSIVDLGTFDSLEQLITHVVMNQLPTGHYTFVINENEAPVFMLLERGQDGYYGTFHDSIADFYYFEVSFYGEIIELKSIDLRDLAAASGDIAYTHHQTSASREWLVCHNLGKYPSVTVVDSAGSVVVGDIAYLNTEELIIRFTSEFSGRAFLN
jgi:hypothetical protein